MITVSMTLPGALFMLFAFFCAVSTITNWLIAAVELLAKRGNV